MKKSGHGWFALAVRIIIGAVFIYAGALKIGDSLQFADNIASFSVLPAFAINVLALGVPIFEILSGGLLIAGLFRRSAALAIVLVSVVFFAAVVSALVRGLTIDCGCFGSSMPSRARMWLDLGRDMMLLAGAFIAYVGVGESPTQYSSDQAY